MPPFVVFPTNRIAHFVEVSLYLFYLAQRVNLTYCDTLNELYKNLKKVKFCCNDFVVCIRACCIMLK